MMHLAWWAWLVVVVLVAGIVYCFTPLAGFLSEAFETYRHRRYMRRLIQDYAKRREEQMSTSWRRTQAYDKNGDKVA